MHKVLLIGKRARILKKLQQALNPQKWEVTLCDNLDMQHLLLLDVSDISVIAFGRALSAEEKEKLAAHYKTKNREITIVYGLAPIPHLLAAQIEAAVSDDTYFSTQNGIIQANQDLTATLDSYRLTFLYQTKHESKTISLQKGSKLEPKTVFQRPGFIVVRTGEQTQVLA